MKDICRNCSVYQPINEVDGYCLATADCGEEGNAIEPIIVRWNDKSCREFELDSDLQILMSIR